MPSHPVKIGITVPPQHTPFSQLREVWLEAVEIGGGEKITLRIVAQHADIWNGFRSPDEIGRKSDVLDEWCVKVGRDPAEIERSVLGDRVHEHADAYVAKGITTLITGSKVPGSGMQAIRDLVAWRDGQ